MISTSENYYFEVRELKKYFPLRTGIFSRTKQHVKAVDNVSFFINRGETFGLIGESGCGKSTVARTIMRLHNPTSGRILLEGVEIGSIPESEYLPYRKRMQMIFQDPYSSLDPRMTVKQIVGEPLTVHTGICSKEEMDDRIQHYLEIVGLSGHHMDRYPHEFSGGQRQRIGIARALIMEPEFIICDEPISALDVSIQAQIVNLFQDLQERMGLTYLFIAHDLAMVKYISDKMGVMYMGQIVETSSSRTIYNNPLHPYTQGLLSSIPVTDPKMAKSREGFVMEGEVPSAINLPPGCRFSNRCEHCMNICTEQPPSLTEVEPDHYVACHLFT